MSVSLEKLVEISYGVSERLYKGYHWDRYSLEDFKQDAAMHIVYLYNRGYFKEIISDNEGGNVAGLLYTLLTMFVKRKLRDDLKRKQREPLIEENDKFDMLLGDTLTPDQEFEISVSKQNGKKVYEQVLENFSQEPFKTQHEYKTSNTILTYYIIAKLILDGWLTGEITEAFADSNVGSSKRQYVQARIREVMKGLQVLIKNLTSQERKELGSFLSV